MPVVEPESGGGDEDGPVGGVLRRGWEGGEEREEGQGESEKGGEAHCFVLQGSGGGRKMRGSRDFDLACRGRQVMYLGGVSNF